jgi:hypothetical protein
MFTIRYRPDDTSVKAQINGKLLLKQYTLTTIGISPFHCTIKTRAEDKPPSWNETDSGHPPGRLDHVTIHLAYWRDKLKNPDQIRRPSGSRRSNSVLTTW